MVWNAAATLLHKAQHLEKPPFIFTVLLASFIGLAAFLYLITNRGTKALQGIPPGSFRWPLIGETLQFLGCQRRGSPQDFFRCRTQQYGNVFTTSLVGHPTVVFYSPQGNRFLFSNENKLVVNSWPTSVGNLFPRSLITAVGDDAKRLRRILMTFLRPEALQKFVGRVDSMTKAHLAHYWIGKDEVRALPLLKRYTFTLACDLFATINNPDEQSKLWHHFMVFVKGVMQIPIDLPEQLDIASSKKAGQLLEWEDLQRMKYSWRVGQEALRLYPAAQGSFRKAIKDFTYEGFTIPKGWKLHWTVNSTHRKSEYFNNPEKFDPSRFEGDGPGDGPPPYTFVPFGGGPRMCPGNEFARMEILVFLHNIVKNFKWNLVIPNEKVIIDPMPDPVSGLPIKLVPHE